MLSGKWSLFELGLCFFESFSYLGRKRKIFKKKFFRAPEVLFSGTKKCTFYSARSYEKSEGAK